MDWKAQNQLGKWIWKLLQYLIEKSKAQSLGSDVYFFLSAVNCYKGFYSGIFIMIITWLRAKAFSFFKSSLSFLISFNFKIGNEFTCRKHQSLKTRKWILPCFPAFHILRNSMGSFALQLHCSSLCLRYYVVLSVSNLKTLQVPRWLRLLCTIFCQWEGLWSLPVV